MTKDGKLYTATIPPKPMFGKSQEPRVVTDLEYKGIEAVLLENQALRLVILPGKGGDILEFRDKQTDVDILWHSDHNWFPPENRYIPSEAPTTWMDHYPGGWQMNLPVAGFGWEIAGNAYGIHGESALIPWETTIKRDNEDVVEVGLSTDLNRYPFHVERDFTLTSGESAIEISETIENRGEVDLEYIWQQHIAIGPPLLSPDARLEIPATAGQTAAYNGDFPNARLRGDTEFEWPNAPGKDEETVDLREIPPRSSESHDLLYLTEMDAGRCKLTNPDLNLSFEFSFDLEQFDSLWYWQPFGGYEDSPYFGRNYNIGIEPTNAYPASNIPEAQRANGSMKSLSAGEEIQVVYNAQLGPDE
jgi:hypothetical protein